MPSGALDTTRNPILGRNLIHYPSDGDGTLHYSRLRVRSELNKRFFLGAVLEREDDIQYRWQDEYVDLISPEWRFDKAYLAWSPGGIWEQIIIGNFTAGFASGLTSNDAHRIAPKGIYTDDTTSLPDNVESGGAGKSTDGMGRFLRHG